MNTRKYPRTMAEAFGPHTNSVLEPMPETDTVTDVPLILAAVAAMAASGTVTDVALVLASVAAVALTVVTLFVWGLV